MKKIIKKSLGLSLALVMLLAVFASTSVFAQGGIEKKVESNLKFEKGLFKGRITGNINVSRTITNNFDSVLDQESNSYKGEIKSNVEAGELFDGAYNLYKTEFEPFAPFGKPWKNIVMYGKDKSSFPSATFTITFPKEVKFNEDDIKIVNNSKSISSIKINNINNEENSIEFIFYLGYWSDYGQFFDIVKDEIDNVGKNIEISIPYSIDSSNSLENLKDIKASGKCELSYFGKRPVINPVVSLDILCDSLNVTR